MKKFEPHELFCAVCFMHDSFFIKDGGWLPTRCPCCGDVGRCIRYEDLTIMQKIKAKKLFKLTWKEKFDVC
jgi:hypothetical protein